MSSSRTGARVPGSVSCGAPKTSRLPRFACWHRWPRPQQREARSIPCCGLHTLSCPVRLGHVAAMSLPRVLSPRRDPRSPRPEHERSFPQSARSGLHGPSAHLMWKTPTRRGRLGRRICAIDTATRTPGTRQRACNAIILLVPLAQSPKATEPYHVASPTSTTQQQSTRSDSSHWSGGRYTKTRNVRNPRSQELPMCCSGAWTRGGRGSVRGGGRKTTITWESGDRRWPGEVLSGASLLRFCSALAWACGSRLTGSLEATSRVARWFAAALRSARCPAGFAVDGGSGAQ